MNTGRGSDGVPAPREPGAPTRRGPRWDWQEKPQRALGERRSRQTGAGGCGCGPTWGAGRTRNPGGGVMGSLIVGSLGRLRAPKAFWSQVWKGPKKIQPTRETALCHLPGRASNRAHNQQLCWKGTDPCPTTVAAPCHTRNGVQHRHTVTRWSVYLQQRHLCSMSPQPGMAGAVGAAHLVSEGGAERALREEPLALHQ